MPSTTLIDVSAQTSNVPSDARIKELFEEAAARQLSPQGLLLLQQFLRDPMKGKAQHDLEQVLNDWLEAFYSAETEISGKDKSRLAAPGGPPDALLGLILHVQCEDDTIDKFWDARSATISLLEEKGINGESTFGYDYHWRADDSFHRKARCPALNWSKSLTHLHNQLSLDLLKILPLPFVIAASNCTRDNIQKHMRSRDAVPLIVELSLGVRLVFDLDFRGKSLHRIIMYLHHPIAGFFASNQKRSALGLQLDSGVNLFLELLKIPHNHDLFTRSYRNQCQRPIRTRRAPIGEMWGYIKQEARESRLLQLSEYTPSFRSWAGKYVGQDPSSILVSGSSLARAAANIVVTRIHRRTKLDEARQKLDLQTKSKISKSHTETENFNSTQLERHPAGHVKVYKSGKAKLLCSRIPLGFRFGKDQATEILAAGGTPEIFFTPTSIEIRIADKVVYDKPLERLLASADNSLWLCQLLHEKESLTMEKEKYDIGTPHTELSIIPHKMQGCGWKNGELKRELSYGEKFHCSELKRKGKVTEKRVYFRGVGVRVPLEAKVDTVSVRADLVPDSKHHTHPCTLGGGQPSDPAHRLGIEVKYETEAGDSKTFWYNSNGDRNIMRLNSLTDFLDGKDDDWTEKQPRRFLDRDHGRRRFQISYTS
ncbi:uncharacterized protein BDR25DRAFT_379339 [Lindgomyces ingoldianus]|uniref:Uncharacterized protein n=1 Tax=Lindgomyces ingoldianus TaxID=673940 RepID=A0ACB6R931_9PLEO|nr:uncharacterized protein BDR25DRAFT_379339 [Lindgomyces ingoldianus]KAF2475783.1 hypothetical protein BDR25DRAFT_379339 [Lindgomyces ingoldianus]